MGDFNQSVILDAIRRSPSGSSRVELARLTRLSAQTISNICRRLLDIGLIREEGKKGVGPGKPRAILRLNSQARYAIGVHLDPTVINFVMLDLTGDVVIRARKQTPNPIDPSHTVSVIAAAIEKLIDDSGVEREKIVGIGIATPGPINAIHGTVIDPPNLSGWHRVTLRDSLSEETGYPVILDKDVTAAAVAEMWASGETGFESFIFVYMGTGIGVGTVLHGEVIRGTSGNAGEVGHIVVDSAGPPCTCGQSGCIAVTCTPRSLVEEAERLGVLDNTRSNNDTLTTNSKFTQLCDAAANGDTVALGIMERSAARMARTVAVLTNMLDVDRVIFGGPMWSRLASYHLPAIPILLEEMRATRSIHQISVVGTSVGEEVGAIGAACLILDHELTPRPKSLLLQG